MSAADVAQAAFVLGCLVGVVSSSVSLGYRTTRFLNLGLVGLAVIGHDAAMILARNAMVDPYLSLPLCFVFGGLVNYVLSRVVYRRLVETEARIAVLTVASAGTYLAMIAFTEVLGSAARRLYPSTLMLAYLKPLDFMFLGVPGVVYVSFSALAALWLLNRVELRKLGSQRFGESWESVNQRLPGAAWVIGGGFSCLAGALLSFWFPVSRGGFTLLFLVVAGTMVGGLMQPQPSMF
ncbi:hypothetical protein JXL21_11815, partial [Candidatus Bathyarchaeota archaeon]|nr:hypothetical protein [Candidatus Bathyarchaeota archaeon]